ncbi:DNA-processing protein DprA [Thermincola ferriacetica]
MMDNRKFLFGLSRLPGIGPRRLELLISYFGSAKEVWQAKPSLLYCIKEIPTKTIDELISLRERTDLEKEINILAEKGISVYTIEDDCYPARLKNIATPPYVLYVRGQLPDDDCLSIAIVGARRCTPYGLKMAEEIARELAGAGVTVISGMARGIDSAAHKGCLEGGGRTVAVLGTGVDIVYPRENRRLMDNIITHGAVVSEFPPGTKAQPSHFPVRNRIISGMADGVLVVEAAQNSGSLITTDLALEQGRDVFAVPGPATSLLSKGTNSLIKQGAKLVECARDILEEYGLDRGRQEKREEFDLNPAEQRILACLTLEPVNIEEIVEKAGMNPAEVSAALTFLELKGLVKRIDGQLFVSNV